MKRTMVCMLIAVCSIALTGCGQKAASLVLPPYSSIQSIDVFEEGQNFRHDDPQWIQSVISGLLASKPTSKPSVQDSPLLDDHVQIDIQLEGGTNIRYLYLDKGDLLCRETVPGDIRN